MRLGNRYVFVGGTLASVAAIVAAWITFGVSGTPNSATSCPLPAYPDATCTGIPAGTSLTVIDQAAYQVTTPNAVVDALDVHGCIDVRAPGVTVKNSRAECITTSQSGSASNPANDPLTVQDSEVDCNFTVGSNGNATGIYYQNIKVYRTDIHDCENGLHAFKDIVVQDSFIHDLIHCVASNCPEPGSPHVDGIESADGSNVAIVHNTIYGMTLPCPDPEDGTCNGTSAININYNSSGPTTHNLLVSNNLLAGGAFAIYCPLPPSVSTRIVGNHFSTVLAPTSGAFGPSIGCANDSPSGNVIHETLDPLTLE